MDYFVYPEPGWVEASVEKYDATFEQKLAPLSGKFCFKINEEQAWGIEKDVFVSFMVEAGKLVEFKHCTEEYAMENCDYIMGATPPAWKRIIIGKDKFVGAFMGGRVKLVKGDTVGALAVGPHDNTIVEVLSQVTLRFPDDLDADELAKFKVDFKAAREERGV